MSRARSLLCSLSVLGACLAWPATGRTDEGTKQRCIRAYEDAQAEQHAGRLLEARQKLLFCSSTACPDVMHADCQSWLAKVDASTPTVVFRVTTPSGAPPRDATVSVDGGAPVVLDGRAISVDPGTHTVVFSATGLRSTSRTFEFSEGEKLRREVIPLESAAAERAAPAPPMTEPAQRSGGIRLSLPVVLAASATAIGAIGATYFGITARAHETDLGDCTPNCTRDSVSRVKREYLLTNVSLGVAIAGLVTTTVLVLTQSPADSPPRSARLGVGASSHQLDLSLTAIF